MQTGCTLLSPCSELQFSLIMFWSEITIPFAFWQWVHRFYFPHRWRSQRFPNTWRSGATQWRWIIPFVGLWGYCSMLTWHFLNGSAWKKGRKERSGTEQPPLNCCLKASTRISSCDNRLWRHSWHMPLILTKEKKGKTKWKHKGSWLGPSMQILHLKGRELLWELNWNPGNGSTERKDVPCSAPQNCRARYKPNYKAGLLIFPVCQFAQWLALTAL